MLLEIQGVNFGFYTQEEIRKISVKQITNPAVLDTMQLPVKDGLYDSALGPFDRRGNFSCGTCKMDYDHCPGHLGHIELCTVTYNPLLFSTLMRVLKSMCFCCHHFLRSNDEIERYVLSMHLLNIGSLSKLAELESIPLNVNAIASAERRAIINKSKEKEEKEEKASHSVKGEKAESDSSEDDTPLLTLEEGRTIIRNKLDELWKFVREETKKLQESGSSKKTFQGCPSHLSEKAKTTHILAKKKQLLRSFFSDLPIKCQNCGAIQPKLRQIEHCKVFRTRITPPKGKYGNLSDDSESDSDSSDGSQSGNESSESSTAAQKKSIAAVSSASQKKSKMLKEYYLRDLETMKDGSVVEKGGKGLVYMPQHTVQAHLMALWEKEREWCTMAFGSANKYDALRYNPHLPNGVSDNYWGAGRTGERKITHKAGKQNESDIESLRPVVLNGINGESGQPKASQGQDADTFYASLIPSPQHFFISCIPVAPNKFRPASVLMGQIFENSQNILLSKIITENNILLNLVKRQKDAQAGISSTVNLGSSASAAISRVAGQIVPGGAHLPTLDQYARPEYIEDQLTQHTIELQIFVNSLFDSSYAMSQSSSYRMVSFAQQMAGAQQDVGQGLKQILESKEGLFRMNMMGKRVNYTARSVISPDPALDTSEIGIPEVFAKHLSFPEGVTEFNVERLKQMIINGPDEHPGAIGLEDSKGRYIDLTHYSAESRRALAKQLGTSYHLKTSSGAAGGGIASAATSLINGGKTPASSSVVLQSMRRGGWTSAEGGGVYNAAPVGSYPRRVYRHLCSGDVVLMNRQPTLHRPSIMAHRVRVLKGQKTIRMHYANCATYNADYDGDEMNMHFLQRVAGRAEGYSIMFADYHYCSPASGAPLRGLIQDHVGAGVLLTKKDTFLTPSEWMQLVYAGCIDGDGFDSPELPSMQTVRPAILKPRKLYTGKQVITALLEFITRSSTTSTTGNDDKGRGRTDEQGRANGNKAGNADAVDVTAQSMYSLASSGLGMSVKSGESNVSEENKGEIGGGIGKGSRRTGRPPLNLISKTKVPADLWGEGHELEGIVNIRNNVLLHGVVEKSQYGASSHGLVHSVHELYGARSAGALLTSLGRLLTAFIQNYHGFTCGIEDMILVESATKKREETLEREDDRVWECYYEFIGDQKLKETFGTTLPALKAVLKPDATSKSPILPHNRFPEKFRTLLATCMRTAQDIARLDGIVKSRLHKVTSETIKNAIPSGLLKSFPSNTLALMTTSGAKGSIVNFSQICCLLGQQELEGKRVPMNSSGRSLPCYERFSMKGVAGGFVYDRFLSGLLPGPYFFHAMAGREGLIDTAVKTSRSGYLQRCLIKGMEGLRVEYDGSVRDVGDGSIVEFLYGEDGTEVGATKMLQNFELMAMNADVLREKMAEEEKIARIQRMNTLMLKREAQKEEGKDGAGNQKIKDPSAMDIEVEDLLGMNLDEEEKAMKESQQKEIELNNKLPMNPIEKALFLDNSIVNTLSSIPLFKYENQEEEKEEKDSKKKSKKEKKESKKRKSEKIEENSFSSSSSSTSSDANSNTSSSAELFSANDPLLARYSPYNTFGVTSEAYFKALAAFTFKNRSKFLPDEPANNEESQKTSKHHKSKVNDNNCYDFALSELKLNTFDKVKERGYPFNTNMPSPLTDKSFLAPSASSSLSPFLASKTSRLPVSAREFLSLGLKHYMRSLITPNEMVGIIAAESIGEPSTQMTLNTFHLAGHGEINVTLGIPRLKEILTTASIEMKTPTMTVQLAEGVTREEAELMAQKLNRVVLADVLKEIVIQEWIENASGAEASMDHAAPPRLSSSSKGENTQIVRSKFAVRRVEIQMDFLPYSTITDSLGVEKKALKNILRERLTKKIQSELNKAIKAKAFEKDVESLEVQKAINDEAGERKKKGKDDDDEEGAGNDEDEAGSGKKKARKGKGGLMLEAGEEDNDDEDEDDDQDEIDEESAKKHHKKEKATYDDDEDDDESSEAAKEDDDEDEEDEDDDEEEDDEEEVAKKGKDKAKEKAKGKKETKSAKKSGKEKKKKTIKSSDAMDAEEDSESSEDEKEKKMEKDEEEEEDDEDEESAEEGKTSKKAKSRSSKSVSESEPEKENEKPSASAEVEEEEEEGDEESSPRFTVMLNVPVQSQRVSIRSLVEKIAKTFPLRSVSGIKRAKISEADKEVEVTRVNPQTGKTEKVKEKKKVLMLMTDGVNLPAMVAFDSIFAEGILNRRRRKIKKELKKRKAQLKAEKKKQKESKRKEEDDDSEDSSSSSSDFDKDDEIEVDLRRQLAKLEASMENASVLLVDSIVSNSVYAMLVAYGVEAARATIISELRSVFNVYGIGVDPRHLALVGEKMTFTGGYTPFSRVGMTDVGSPLQRMSFETTLSFMSQSAISGESDNTKTASGAIVVGRRCRLGTGAVEVMQDIVKEKQLMDIRNSEMDWQDEQALTYQAGLESEDRANEEANEKDEGHIFGAQHMTFDDAYENEEENAYGIQIPQDIDEVYDDLIDENEEDEYS